MEQRRPWLTLLDTVARPSGHSLAPQQWKSLFDATKQLADDRDHVEESLKIGSILLRDVLHALVGVETSAVTNIDLLPRLKTWAQALGLKGIQKLEEGIERAHSLQNRNVNQQLTYDSLAAEVLSSPPRS